MPNARTLLAVSFVLALSAASVRAGEAGDASMDILRDTIRANKKALVDVNMQLSDEEAKKFWPVYDRYQNDLKAVHDRYVRIIKDYQESFETLSDDKASKLIDDYLSAETDRAKVRREYLDDFEKVLPGLKVARFYQIENKMDAVLRYELAAGIPVVKQ